MNRSEWRCFVLAAVLHLLLAAWLLPGHPSGPAGTTGTFAAWDGDTFSYLDPVENLLRTGTYAQDLARPDSYAGRMPGYGIVYGLLRLALPPGAAADALVLLQLLLSLVALYCLARLAQVVTRQPAAFRWALLLYGLNTFVTVYDIRVLTESFATSALIIGLYELVKMLEHPTGATAGRLLRVGCWLAWAVFLRPFLAPLLGLLAVATAVLGSRAATLPDRPRGFRALRGGLLLLLPFLVVDAAWVARNWPWYQRPVLLQSNAWAGYRTAPGLPALADFIGTIGEEPSLVAARQRHCLVLSIHGSRGPEFSRPAAQAGPAGVHLRLAGAGKKLARAGLRFGPAAGPAPAGRSPRQPGPGPIRERLPPAPPLASRGARAPAARLPPHPGSPRRQPLPPAVRRAFPAPKKAVKVAAYLAYLARGRPRLAGHAAAGVAAAGRAAGQARAAVCAGAAVPGAAAGRVSLLRCRLPVRARGRRAAAGAVPEFLVARFWFLVRA